MSIHMSVHMPTQMFMPQALYGILFHIQNWFTMVFSYGFNCYFVSDMVCCQSLMSRPYVNALCHGLMSTP